MGVFAMSDIRPKKSQGSQWVVRVSWKTQCPDCWEFFHQEMSRREKHTPSFLENDFMVPAAFLEWKCPHSETKPHLFESFYVKKESGTQGSTATTETTA